MKMYLYYDIYYPGIDDEPGAVPLIDRVVILDKEVQCVHQPTHNGDVGYRSSFFKVMEFEI